MKLTFLIVFALLIVSAIAYSKDEERHRRRLHRRRQTDLVNNENADSSEVEEMAEQPNEKNDTKQFGRHGRRRGCKCNELNENGESVNRCWHRRNEKNGSGSDLNSGHEEHIDGSDQNKGDRRQKWHRNRNSVQGQVESQNEDRERRRHYGWHKNEGSDESTKLNTENNGTEGRKHHHRHRPHHHHHRHHHHCHNRTTTTTTSTSTIPPPEEVQRIDENDGFQVPLNSDTNNNNEIE